ncbi:hypothetical protein FACS189443_0660 [Planctomycetales bacterium]|nr:hypothetical protein FACS189443_0660 [Planctomycetales bacterium]
MKTSRLSCLFLFFILSASILHAEDITLSNSADVKIQIPKTTSGWGLGTIFLHGKPLESPLNDGVLFLRKNDGSVYRPVPADDAKRIDDLTVELTGKTEVDGVALTFKIKVALDKDKPVVYLTPSWKVEKNLPDWEVCFAYHDNKFTGDWRVQSYPYAGNSTEVNITPMRYCGVPGALLYHPDLSTIILFTIDSRSDYLNPTTWTGKTQFTFKNGKMAPSFCAGSGGKLDAGIDYELPLQLILDDSGKFVSSIPNIMKTWMKVTDYKVDTTLFVRTPQEGYDIVANARRNPSYWVEGIGFRHNNTAPFCYPGEYPAFSVFDYRMYLKTGETFWRERSFKHINYLLKGQIPDGAFHTTYNLKTRDIGHYYNFEHFKEHYKHSSTILPPGFCSADHDHLALKPDINAMTAQNLLRFWKMVKDNEGVDHKEWYDAAVKCLDWILAQQNEDGGFSQCVDIVTGKHAVSTLCGRTMVCFPYATEITGDPKYLQAALKAEKWMRDNVQNKFWYTGSHPDLPPEDFEADGVFNVIGYWLDKYDRTKEQDALDNAVANAYYALLHWCPKQLSWVKSPTQLAHSEQVSYNTYAVFTYNNRKFVSLDRLYRATKEPLFLQVRDRSIQNILFTQSQDPKWAGSVSEAIADPWLEQGQGFEYKGVVYPDIALEFIMELYDLGLAK